MLINVNRVALKTLKLDEYTKRSAFGSTEGRFRKCKTENSNPKLKMTITTTLNIRTIWNCEGNEHKSFETPRHDSNKYVEIFEAMENTAAAVDLIRDGKTPRCRRRL